MRKLSLIMALVLLLTAVLPGCHGKVERVEFQVPEEFDTSRQ